MMTQVLTPFICMIQKQSNKLYQHFDGHDSIAYFIYSQREINSDDKSKTSFYLKIQGRQSVREKTPRFKLLIFYGYVPGISIDN